MYGICTKTLEYDKRFPRAFPGFPFPPVSLHRTPARRFSLSFSFNHVQVHKVQKIIYLEA